MGERVSSTGPGAFTGPESSVEPGESLGALLRRAYTRFTAEAGDDPQSRAFVLLDTLADQDAGSQQELAERLGINRTIMVRLVDELQADGFVTRTRNPANRRSYVLSITAAGRAARDAMRAVVAEREARVTSALSPVERQLLDKILTRLLPDPEHVASTGYLVAQAHYRLRRTGDAMLSEVGLRTRHFGFLGALAELAPCPQQRLARRLDITEPAAAQIADELVRLGLIVRGQDPDDRRRYALDLTPLGRERLVFVAEASRTLNGEVVALLGEEAAADLRVLLKRLITA
ncbi:MarR family winged helix-turn-helix transcriptional regulator [Actinocorallia longicatena]|uniref:HTH marR-type domain-containing protein n=1 Tax=Actinocorallia longicatena TaxID=111803 RepID=A0ABP6QHW3_9ACTN